MYSINIIYNIHQYKLYTYTNKYQTLYITGMSNQEAQRFTYSYIAINSFTNTCSPRASQLMLKRNLITRQDHHIQNRSSQWNEEDKMKNSNRLRTCSLVTAY